MANGRVSPVSHELLTDWNPIYMDIRLGYGKID